jgi:hypothetical protein
VNLAGMLVVSALSLLRVPFLGIRLTTPSDATGAGTALSSLVQLLMVALGLVLVRGVYGRSIPANRPE